MICKVWCLYLKIRFIAPAWVRGFFCMDGILLQYRVNFRSNTIMGKGARVDTSLVGFRRLILPRPTCMQLCVHVPCMVSVKSFSELLHSRWQPRMYDSLLTQSLRSVHKRTGRLSRIVQRLSLWVNPPNFIIFTCICNYM